MLEEFYGIEPGFPLSTHLITRCLDKELPKRLYYVSDGLLGVRGSVGPARSGA